jgi:hypothetical protein
MSRYKPRTQPPPPGSGYRSLKTADTSATTSTVRRSESTKATQAADDGFMPIKQSPPAARRRPRQRRPEWSKRDVVEIVSLLAVVGTVIGTAVTLTYKLGTVGDKVAAVGTDVTTVKETQIADHTKLEEVRSDVVELRRDVQDLRERPAPASAASPPMARKVK